MGQTRNVARELEWRRAEHEYKSAINLAAFAAQRYSYELRRRESYRRVKVLKNAAMNHKIVVGRNATDGHWIYFSIETPDPGDKQRRGLDRRGDNGTIVDFILKREKGIGMREVHAECRRWLGRPDLSTFEQDYTVTPSKADERSRIKVAVEYESALLLKSSRYLHGRGLRCETLEDDRFHDAFRIGRYGNALFPHRDEHGVSGYEAKNHGFTSFARGGTKTLWRSVERDTDRVLVVAESAIDALSYHQLHPRPDARYVSFGGWPREEQLELLRKSAGELRPGGGVLLAFDRDEGGDKLTEVVRAALAREPIDVARHSPAVPGWDWNDVVKRREQRFIRDMTVRDGRTPRGLER